MNKVSLKKLSQGRLLIVIAALFVFIAGFVFGSSYQRGQTAIDLAKFWRVYGLIEDRYIGSIDDKKAREGAIIGLVESLDDPYSAYLPEEEKKKLDEELKGEFQGIGAVLSQKDGKTEIVEVLPESPALRAGLKERDVIIQVGEVVTDGLTLEEVVREIRGPKDTEVTIHVSRDGEVKEITVKRDVITLKSVSAEMKSGGIGYIEIKQFGDDTVEAFALAVREIAEQNPKALIIDLRDNPGGYLNTVSPIAGEFLPPSVIVKERFKGGRVEELRSTGLPTLPNTPLYILVNGGSASASEILAGALQDYDRATVIGEKTYGKGSVQDVIPLTGNTALRLTIAEWITPKDRQINKEGIKPDVEVSDERTDEADPILEKALELSKQ